MGLNIVAAVAIFVSVASGQRIRQARPSIATMIPPTVQPTIVDGNIVQSLIDTLQLFIVSDLLEETLPEKQKVVTPAAIYDAATPYGYLDYDLECDVPLYPDLIFDVECPEIVTAFVPNCKPPPSKRLCLNFGLNEELILPPLASELPCGLGYLPGSLPVVAKAFAPCSKCCGCGYGSAHCSSAALPVCSPYSCTALATPLSPELSPCVKSIIL